MKKFVEEVSCKWLNYLPDTLCNGFVAHGRVRCLGKIPVRVIFEASDSDGWTKNGTVRYGSATDFYLQA